jgi:tripartite-type tricarboxylate transporter receptor subunit TctC
MPRSLAFTSALTLLAACLALGTTLAAAQTMPTQAGKPVSLVVSFPAGGAPDQIARLLGQQLQARWKVPVVVNNKPGAAGHLGNDSVARAEPDGHTLLITPNTFTMAPHVLASGAQKPADVLTDFTPIALLSSSSMLLLAHPSLGVKNARELASKAKADKGLSYASSGNGTPMHIAGELFNHVAGLQLDHVPYRGTTPAINDVLGGHVKLTYLGLPVAKPLIDAGKLVPLAVVDKARSPLLPDVPTMAEQGFAGVETDIWFGVYGPRGLPKALADDIHRAFNDALKAPEVAAQFKTMSQVVHNESREAFVNKTRADHQRYGDIIRQFRITAD